jgi:hypothetical protein
MLSKKLVDLGRSIDRARRSNPDPGFQLGIRHVAHALADDLCTAVERYHFLLICGVEFKL